MPSLAATTTQTVEVRLKPSVRRLLLNELQAYATLHAHIKELEEQEKGLVANIRAIREETGEEALELEGFKIRNVPGQVSYLDKQLFVQLGGSLEQLANATRSKPKKAYERISVPGQKEGRGNDE